MGLNQILEFLFGVVQGIWFMVRLGLALYAIALLYLIHQQQQGILYVLNGGCLK